MGIKNVSSLRKFYMGRKFWCLFFHQRWMFSFIRFEYELFSTMFSLFLSESFIVTQENSIANKNKIQMCGLSLFSRCCLQLYNWTQIKLKHICQQSASIPLISTCCPVAHNFHLCTLTPLLSSLFRAFFLISTHSCLLTPAYIESDPQFILIHSILYLANDQSSQNSPSQIVRKVFWEKD